MAGATPTDRIIVKFKEPQARLQVLADGAPGPERGRAIAQLSARVGRDVAWQRAMSGGADVLRLPRLLPLAEVESVAAEIARLPEVEYAEPDRRMFPSLVPDDTYYGQQWHYHAADASNYGINLPPAWDLATGDAVVVAVLDTGILFRHADFAGKVLPGYDFVSEDAPGLPWMANDGDGRDADAADPGDWITAAEAAAIPGCTAYDSSWHGTHVAGTIAAATHNGLGVAGVSWGAQILPLRVLGKCGGYTSVVADAIRWAAGLSVDGAPVNPFPARVINMSLGGAGSCGETYQNAINAANAQGAVVIVAAGNNNASLDSTAVSPAVCNDVVTVAATDRAGNRADYSNYGSAVAIAAPGGDGVSTDRIRSTWDGGSRYPANDSGYAWYRGTSMATPHVAGIAALLLARDQSLTRDEVISLLTGNVTAFPGGSNCTTAICGAGIANAGATLAATDDAGHRPNNTLAFVTQTNVAPGTTQTSNPATVYTGAALDVAVQGGEYSIEEGTYTTEPGTLTDGQTIRLRHTASALGAHPAATLLTVGNHRTAFVSLTTAGDAAPDAYTFTMQTNAARGVTATSNTITLTGIDAPAPIGVSGGEYSLNCLNGGYTTEPGYIAPGGSVCVRHTTAADYATDTATTLSIGGVQGSFVTTTEAAPPSSGGGGGGALAWWWLLVLALGMATAQRRQAPNLSAG
jgi:serine protease